MCGVVGAVVVAYLANIAQASFADWSGWVQVASVTAVLAVPWIAHTIVAREPKARHPRAGSGIFAGRRHREARAIEAIREQIATADRQTRAMLADGIARVDSLLAGGLDERQQAQAATDTAIESLRYWVTSSAADIPLALDRVADLCALLAERIEADCVERRALTEAITAMGRPAIQPVESSSRVIGSANGCNGLGSEGTHSDSLVTRLRTPS